MASLTQLKPFNFEKWIAENEQFLKPPVNNKQLFDVETQMTVMIIGGPNKRVDFHDDPVEEYFHQMRGDMVLKIADRGKIFNVPIKEGEVFIIPAHCRHSPQRPEAGSMGFVVEGTRKEEDIDAFEWFCMECGDLVHRVEVKVTNIVKDLPPLFDAFYEDEKARVCSSCDATHPGKEPPADWLGYQRMDGDRSSRRSA